ncbi:MAG: DUF2855 family protein [Chloroflexota bacterium]
MNPQLLITKNNIGECEIYSANLPKERQIGRILCKIDKVALTANNVTYAVIGAHPSFRYWQFFPVEDESKGLVPVWGFADVVESTHPEIEVGERLYGYWPLAGYLELEPSKVSTHGFVDGARHRQDLSLIYNQYVRTAVSQEFTPENEPYHAIMRPMFTTSFLLDDYLWESAPEAGTFIISSASSKTGYGTAFQLKNKRGDRAPYQIVGLTSASNVEYVKKLGLYDMVLPYSEVSTLPHDGSPVAYADFSGNAALRQAIHEKYTDALIRDVVVGVTDWTRQGSAQGLPGAKPENFFAPSQAQKRISEWGGSRFMLKVAQDLMAFISYSAGYMHIVEVEPMKEVGPLWENMVNGKVDPSKGYILRPSA